MIKECTREEYEAALKDNIFVKKVDDKLVLHKPICVKERGKSFTEGEHGLILKPDDCYMDVIGPFTEIEDFWDKCDEKFQDDEFMVVSHPRQLGKIFVWTGNYHDFTQTWELD